MDISEKKELGKQLIGYVFLIAVGCFCLGYFVGNVIPVYGSNASGCLTDSDVNKIALVSNFTTCQHYGLRDDFLVQQDSNGGYFGVPVCR